MKTTLEEMWKAEKLTKSFRVIGLPDSTLSRIKEKKLIWPYVAPFSRRDPTPMHVGYEYFIGRSQITKEVWLWGKRKDRNFKQHLWQV